MSGALERLLRTDPAPLAFGRVLQVDNIGARAQVELQSGATVWAHCDVSAVESGAYAALGRIEGAWALVQSYRDPLPPGGTLLLV